MRSRAKVIRTFAVHDIMNFVVALLPEARPLIECFKLRKRKSTSPFPIFENTDYRLIVSGIGQVRAAAATGYMLGQMIGTEPLLNIGIAGHGTLPVGEAFIGNRIFLREDKSVYYPPPVLDPSIPTSALQTIDHPEKNYPDSIGYDMEAHAICTIGYRSITRELVQVLKIVSDNPSNPLEKFTPDQAVTLITDKISLIEDVVSQMKTLAKELAVDPILLELISEIQSSHHFSVTESHQLRRYLERASALGIEVEKIQSTANSSQDGKSILSFLEGEIKSFSTFS